MLEYEINVFSKNFRGLAYGWNEIKVVNFLVGENNTGKTSFLNLVSILDSFEFMYHFEISDIVDGLNVAFDIISRRSEDKTVTIGFFNRDNKTRAKEKKIILFGRLVTYKDIKGTLDVDTVTFLANKVVFKITKRGKKLMLKYIDCDINPKLSNQEIARRFEEVHFAKQRGARTIEEAPAGGEIDSSQWIYSAMDAVRKLGAKRSGDEDYPVFTNVAPLGAFPFGPIRGETKRVYYGKPKEFDPKGEHYPYELKKISDVSDETFRKINEFGKESQLFDEIKIQKIRAKLPESPFTIKLIRNGKEYFADELGYGVSQILPIISDLLGISDKRCYLLQQPEVHLHPRAQAALGDIFFDVASRGKILIVETHSDYIMSRFRIRISQSENEIPAEVIFFYTDPDSGENRTKTIPIGRDGRLNEVPESYRSFFIDEEIRKLELL